MKSKIKVLIADDHTMFRQTLRRVLDSKQNLEVVAEASDGNELIKKCQQSPPDVVLVDLQMPNVDGIEATRILKEANPNIGVIALTMHEDDEYLFGAIRAGVNGYILKVAPLHKLLRYIKEIALGENILNSSIAKRVIGEFMELGTASRTAKTNKLTPREQEILQLLASGKAPKELARKLFISEKTVNNHIANIYGKLECHDRTQAILTASRLGLIEVEQKFLGNT